MGLRRFFPEKVRICGRAYFSALARDVNDTLRGRERPHLVPPARYDTNGNGDYISVGDAWGRRFRDHGLDTHSNVLEIGCGTGRIARALAGQLSGAYHGFDVLRSAVEWASRAFREYPNFAFTHLDVFNDLYNPRGRPIGNWLQIPSPPKDFAFATSLFSHLDPDAAQLYIERVRRILHPGGTFVSTWYLYGPDTLSRSNLRHDLPHDFGHFRRQSLRNPAYVVAYDEDWLVKAFSDFSFVQIVEGQWRGGSYAGQDVVIARI